MHELVMQDNGTISVSGPSMGGSIAEDALPNARSQIMANEDILANIFSQLRDLLDLDDLSKDDPSPSAAAEGEADAADHNGTVEEPSLATKNPSWKRAFASLVLVNHAFFPAGANILWNTMEELAAVFKLLPWFETEYKGIGTSDTNRPETWERFKLYSALVKRFDLKSHPNISQPTPWFLQLLTLPGRPDPFFPHLQSLSFAPAAAPALYLLFLLTGPSLLNLEVVTCSELEVLGKTPSDWSYMEDHEAARSFPALRDLLAALPRITHTASQLQSFHYRGPVVDELFHHISALRSLTTIDIVLASEQDVRQLRTLRQLPALGYLKIVAPSLHERGQSSETAREASDEHFACLRTLHVEAMEHSQWLIWRCLQPRRLRSLVLYLGGTGENLPFYASLGSYLRSNVELESLFVEFVETESTDRVEDMARWPSSSLAEDAARNALTLCTHLTDVTFLNVPSSLCSGVAALLQKSMPHWKNLVSLVFRAQNLASTEDGEASADKGLPGLSFLFMIARQECPALRTLEFCFSADRIKRDMNDDVVRRVVHPCGNSPSELSQDDHPLRGLTINTSIPPIPRSPSLYLEYGQTINLALYLDRLFPQLAILDGPASQTWTEVEPLIKAFQTVREHAVTRLGSILQIS